MTSVNLKDIKDCVLKSVKNNFKNDGSLLSCAIIISNEGKMSIIGMPFKTQEEKIWMLNQVRDACVKLNAIALFIISEAWRKTIEKENQHLVADYKSGKKKISDSDDKEECVFVIYETKLTSESISFEIDRSNNELINMTSGISSGGNFSDILCEAVNLN